MRRLKPSTVVSVVVLLLSINAAQSASIPQSAPDILSPRAPTIDLSPAVLFTRGFAGRFASFLFAPIAVDAQGNSYVAGSTSSPDLPTTPGAFQPRPVRLPDVFVAKIDRNGNVVYLTYLGGND